MANDTRGGSNLTRITVPREGMIWQAACSHLGQEALQALVTDLLINHGQRPRRNSLLYLRREWLGIEALEALQAALKATDLSWPAFDDMPNTVAILECYRWYLAIELLKALPVNLVPDELKGRRIELDMGL